MNTQATIGALIVGLGILVYRVVKWWPGRKALAKHPAIALDLVPFVLGLCFGTLVILCTGGLIGWAADATLWAGGWVGDGALIWGVGGYREGIGRGPEQALTNGGHAVTLVLCFAVLAVLRKKRESGKLVGQGIVAGIMLGTIRGYAGLMAIPLASSVNLAGAWISTGVLH